MTLETYCQAKRTIILNPGASAYEAVRALENAHVGAVVVQESGNVVGIVTDRDLALRVIGFELDAKTTRLGDVMTPGPATLSVDDTVEQAAALMRARHVRRIPIVDSGRAVGIVTLDDLILSDGIDVDTAAGIIEAELAEPAPGKPAGELHPVKAPVTSDREAEREQRHAARAAQTLHEFTGRLQGHLDLDDPERALQAFMVVAQALVRRLMPAEAADFAAQLPSALRDRLLVLPAGPDKSITLDSLREDMSDTLHVDAQSADTLVRRIAASLPEFVSAGELRHVVHQLPPELKAVFARTQ